MVIGLALKTASTAGNIVGKSIGGASALKKATLRRTRVTKQVFERNKIIERRTKERKRRLEKESALEVIKKGGRLTKKSIGAVAGSSIFEKGMDLIGLVLVGWLVNNLPSIIKQVQDFIDRARLFVKSIKSFGSNLSKTVDGLFNVVKTTGSEWLKGNFKDEEGKINQAIKELKDSIGGIGKAFEDAKTAVGGDMEDVNEKLGGGGGSTANINPADFSKDLTADERAALAVLAKYESGAAGYDAVNQIGIAGGRGVVGFSGDIKNMSQHGGKSLTDMTVGEIKALQYDDGSMSNSQWIKAGKLHATGRYQFIGNTLPGVAARAGITDDMKFNKDVQDRMALQLMRERGISPWVGPSDKATRAERAIVAKVANQRGGSNSRRSGYGNNVVEYITGDRNHSNYDYAGHGTMKNYHDHIAFSSVQEKERAKRALRAEGIVIGSEFRKGDPGWHGADRAIDIPGDQWGGSGAIGQTEFNGSAKVRQVLLQAGFGGAGLGTGKMETLPRNASNLRGSGGSGNNIMLVFNQPSSSPAPLQSESMIPIVIGTSLNSVMKNHLLLDLAYT